MIRDTLPQCWLWSALIVLLVAREAVATGGTVAPPIPGFASRGADASVATSTGKTIPNAPVVADDDDDTSPLRRVVWELVEVTLRAGVRTQVVAGPGALEPGGLVLDVTLPADARTHVVWVAIPTWR